MIFYVHLQVLAGVVLSVDPFSKEVLAIIDKNLYFMFRDVNFSNTLIQILQSK